MHVLKTVIVAGKVFGPVCKSPFSQFVKELRFNNLLASIGIVSR